MYGCVAGWGGERLQRFHRKLDINVYSGFFVLYIWMLSSFSNIFNAILGLLKYLKDFLKQHWILSQRITCMVYQWIVHAVYTVMFHVLQRCSVFNSLSLAKSVCHSTVKWKSQQWGFKAAYLLLMGPDNPPLSGWFYLLSGGNSESALLVSLGEGCPHTRSALFLKVDLPSDPLYS